MTRSFAIALLASTALIPAAARAQSAQLPSGGTVTAGSARIEVPAAGGLAITQSSERAIINWRDFSIAAGQRVDIVQPEARSVLLNRVTGDAASTIAGTFSANGQVFLVNPNGILITSGGAVNAAGFVASTLDIADQDFLDGKYDFSVTSRRGAVINQGRIDIARGGYAALLGGAVASSGLIRVPLGKVAIGAAERATLDFTGDGFLQVALAASPSAAAAVVRAQDALQAARAVVNLTSYDEAVRVGGRDGAVVLGGAVDVSGGGRGGSVTVAGQQIALGGAKIDASGTGGGGTIRIGGEYQGRGALAHAATLAADATTRLVADATGTGAGGSVVLWSDAATSFAGAILARGADGAGGDAEVSSWGLLDYRGTADLTGTRFGTLLLDPYNITIGAGSDARQSGFVATGNESVINANTLLAALQTANVVVSTGTGGTQAGNITVAAPLAWSTDATLTLNAVGAIAIDAAISAQAGGLTLNAGGGISATGAINIARFTLVAGSWAQNAAALPGFASADFRIAGSSSFLRAAGGSGTAAEPYRIADVYGLQGIGSSATLRAASYRLAQDVDASLTRYWNGGAGFDPIGDGSNPFRGSFDGDGHGIEGLYIYRPATSRVGLFAGLAAGSLVEDLDLHGDVTGDLGTGLLAGEARGVLRGIDLRGSITGMSYNTGSLAGLGGGDISRVRAEVTVQGKQATGGLVGAFGSGTLSDSHVSGSVSGANYVGGLAGTAGGTISRTYSEATVQGSQVVGGLLGQLAGRGVLADSYATGTVTATNLAGGLVGEGIASTIVRSYASGAVNAATRGAGLAGNVTNMTVANSYWDVHTTGRSAGAGNGAIGTGLTTAEARLASSYAGFDFDGTWFQSGDMRPIGRWEANPAGADGRIAVDNLHQLQLIQIANNKTYYLTRDLDASATAGIDAAGVWGATGFRPLTSSNFDGRSHSITGLTINLPSVDNVGLFGSILANYWVRDLTLANVSITGKQFVGALMGTANGNASVSGVTVAGGVVRGNNAVGGMIGRSWGVLSQLTSSAKVDAGIVSAYNDVGGLLGLMNGGSVTRASASGNVTGFSGVGGLVGSMIAGTVQQSFATNAVSANDNAGGLVGFMSSGTIFQAYSEGSVAGQKNLGGLIGFAGGSTTIRQVYSTTSVTGGSYLGGLVGDLRGGVLDQAWTSGRVTGSFRSPVAGPGSHGTVTNVFSDGDSSGNITYFYDMPELPTLTTAQARSRSSYTGFDFDNVWFWADGMRPIGRWELPVAGTDGYIEISNAHQLQLMAANLAGNYRLAGDVDASATAGLTAGAGIWSNAGFNPVGTSQAKFTGALDGAGHAIVGLTIDRPSASSVGLFGWVATAQVHNVGLSGGSIAGGTYVGSLIGQFDHGTVSDSWSSANVSGLERVGGLIGKGWGGITRSHASGTVTGRVDASTRTSIGGLVGDFAGTVERSYATGNIFAPQTQSVGGLVGFIGGGTFNVVAESHATGTVTGKISVGGLAGGMDMATLRDVYALGTVTAEGNAGGLVGDSYQSNIQRAYAAGAANGTVGGLFGRLMGANSISSAYWDISRNGATAALTGTLTTAAGLTTEQMQEARNFAAMFAGFDFNGVWIPPNAAGDAGQDDAHYPTLASTQDALVVRTAPVQVYGERPILHYSGLRAGDFVTTLGAVSGSANRGVGSHDVTIAGVAAAGSSGASYRIVVLPGTIDVTPRPITVIASGQTRHYGNSNVPLAYTIGGMGLASGDALSGALSTLALPTSNVGIYAVSQGTLAASANYALTFVGADLVITPRPITVAAIAASRLYGESNPAFAYTIGGQGLVHGDTLTGALLTGAGVTSGIGTYAIGQGTLAASPNYALTYVGADLAIIPRPITIAADSLSRIYGEANPMLTYTVGGMGLVNGDVLTGRLTTLAGPTSGVGNYAISVGSLNAGSNYAATFTGADLAVTPRPIVIAADALSRIYGEANPTLSYSIAGMGLVNGDILSGALSTAAASTSGVGSYRIALGSISAGSNYAVAYADADLTITPRPIMIAAHALSRIYGEANPALSYSVAGMGLVNGDALTGALATSAGAASGVGSYAIRLSSLAASDNYAVTYAGADMTVTPRPITVTADAGSRIYGDPNPVFSYSVGGMGLVNSDLLSGTLSTTAGTTSGVGSYRVTLGSLAAGDNYTVTFVSADMTVTPRPIAITAHALSRIYGEANPVFTYSLAGMGLVNGDTLSGALNAAAGLASPVGTYGIGIGNLNAGNNYDITYSGAELTVTPRPISITADALNRIYGEANPALTYAIGGMGLRNGDVLSGTLSTTASSASGVGTYAIGLGSLAASGNYLVTYSSADLTITPRLITITADALSRVYGEANPALTYAIGGMGLANGDVLSGTPNTAANMASNVGSYGITRGGLTAGGNYTMTFVGADLTVTPRPITIAADPLRRIYGAANPVPTYSIGGMGLVNGDVLDGELATIAGPTSGIGAYAIGQGSLNGGGNYAITYRGASLTIEPRPITVVADQLSRVYGETNPVLTYSVGGLGLVNGDMFHGALATAAGPASGVGSHAIELGSLSPGANYALTYTGAQLVVTPRPITITADALSRIYGQVNPSLSYTIGGMGLVNGDTLTGALATLADPASQPGSYAVTQGDLAASSNYAVRFEPGVLRVLPVAPRPVEATPGLTGSLPVSSGRLSRALPMPKSGAGSLDASISDAEIRFTEERCIEEPVPCI